jgi:hypothetical protein
VAEQELSILEADAGGPKPMAIRVLEIMNPETVSAAGANCGRFCGSGAV